VSDVGDRIATASRAHYAPEVEFVERKGAGHPDTLCDHLAESLARRLSAALAGAPTQHFNVDKGLLVAGAVDVDYGGGCLVQPSRVIIAGRVELARSSVQRAQLETELHAEITRQLPEADPEGFDVELRVQRPSGELAALGFSGGEVPRANDTSFAFVSLPRSPLEELTYRLERHLTTHDVRQRLRIGPDVKVMGSRIGDRVRMTVAAAMLAARIRDRADYEAAVEEVAHEARELATEVVGHAPDVAVNSAGGGAPYLTLSGSSAEAGDDGQVGRGNRFGGLITPLRPMSLEACAGKNPVNHVGKTYHCVAHDIAQRILVETPAREATVGLLSRIGNLVTQPQAVRVELVGDVRSGAVQEIVEQCLADWRAVQDRLLTGTYVLF
jgi:S-adenosylmethionine synthetase